MPSLVEIGQLILEKKSKNVKSQHTDGQTDRSTFGRKELDGQSGSHIIYNSELCFQGCIIIYQQLYIEKNYAYIHFISLEEINLLIVITI